MAGLLIAVRGREGVVLEKLKQRRLIFVEACGVDLRRIDQALEIQLARRMGPLLVGFPGPEHIERSARVFLWLLLRIADWPLRVRPGLVRSLLRHIMKEIISRFVV